MKPQRRNSLILIAGILTVFVSTTTFWSCDNTFHVFDDIQTEVKQVGTDIFKNTTVKALGDDGTNYYAALAKIWYRPITGSAWNVLPIGVGTADTDYYSYSLVSDGALAVYVAIEKNDSTAVYKGTAAGTTWTSITLGSLDGLYMDELYYSNSILFALAHSGTGSSIKYSLHYSNGTAAFATTNLINLDTPLLGISYDGINFLAPTSAKVYKAASATGPWSEATPAGDKSFGGIVTDHANDIHLSTQDGYLYTWDGSAWSAAKTIKANQTLGIVAEVETTPGSAVYRLLVAHANTGYYEFDGTTALAGDDSGSAFGTPVSAYTTTIYGKTILAVHTASAASGVDEILIGLASQGSSTGYALYSNEYVSGAWSGWSAE